MTSHRIGSLTTVAALVLVGCSGGGGSGDSRASLTVALMDAPVDGVTAVHVRITGIELKGSDGPATPLTLADGPRTVNLMELTDTNAAILVDDAEIAPGHYEWLSMDVSADFDNVMDSYVVTDTGGQVELRVPSGRVRLVSGFDVGENESVQFLFDWSVRHGLVAPTGQAGYFLKPAFRMLDVTEYGVLSGTVAAETITGAANSCNSDDANLDLGNVVYVFAGANITPDDIDGTDDAIATADVVPVAGVYSYRVALAPGDYTVAFTCRAADDDPEVDDTLVFLPAVNVVITGSTVTQNF